MPVRKLREFLNRKEIKYVSISHSPGFTAQEIAALAHIPGKKLAKTVVVNLDGEMALAVLPAPSNVHFDMLREAAQAHDVTLATEDEFKDRFPDCEVGAMPPFGNLYGMRTFVADTLAEDSEIAFNAGSHTELIQMTYADFERLAEPTVLRFTANVA